jgi:hypothetical protein
VDVLWLNEYALTEKSTLGQYVLVGSKHQNRIVSGAPRTEDPIWVGIRAFGREKFKLNFPWIESAFLKDVLKPYIQYWFDFAFVTGTVANQDLRGFGFDVGGTYIARKFSSRPYFTLGYAFGSGDKSPPSGRLDRNFRQSGFHSNTGKLGGVVNFEYYGVLLDPELSNLQIFTVGAGLRPWPKTSIDLVYHHYEQNIAARQFRQVEVSGTLDGKQTNLGDEIDVVIGIREFKQVRFRLRNGYFIPGPAFIRDDPSFFSRFDIQIPF